MSTIDVAVVTAEALAEKARNFAASVEQVKERASQYEAFLSALDDAPEEIRALVRITKYDIMYGGTVSVPRSALTTIRKIVGRMTTNGKSLAWDFKTTNEVVVTLIPVAKEWNRMAFAYRTPYRRGGKCHVETVISTSETLICKR